MSHKQNDIWNENLQELEDEKEFEWQDEVQGAIGRATTSHLEHQRDTYWEMVCEQLDREHEKFLTTLLMIDRELTTREVCASKKD